MKMIVGLISIALTVAFSQGAFAVSDFGNSGRQVKEYIYDFSVNGGSTGAIALATGKNLPSGAIVTGIHYIVVTALTSAGSATLAIGDAASGARYQAATAYDNAVYAAGNVKNMTSAQVPNEISAGNEAAFNVTIGTAALTAGKIKFFVDYIMPSSK